MHSDADKISYKRFKYTYKIFNKINLIISDHLRSIYEYNNIVKNYGYYLKPVHMVVKQTKSGKIKYYYYGRYWYRIEYVKGSKSRIKWIYIGRNKPDPRLPDPPNNPLEGTVIKVGEDSIEIIAPEKVSSLLSKALKIDQTIKGAIEENVGNSDR